MAVLRYQHLTKHGNYWSCDQWPGKQNLASKIASQSKARSVSHKYS